MRRFLLAAVVALVVSATAASVSAQTFGVDGTFVGLRTDGALDVVSTANFPTASTSITLTRSSSSPLIAVTRRPNNGFFYFLDEAGQIWSGDVDTAIKTNAATVAINTVGSAISSRSRQVAAGGVGFNFNPVGDLLRIINNATNFRVSPTTGAGAGTTAGGDGADAGSTFVGYSTAPANALNIVATAYTNQGDGRSPRNATAPNSFGTTQYAIDAGNAAFVTLSAPNTGAIGASQPLSPTFDLTSGVGLTVVSSSATPPANTVVASLKAAGASTYGLYTIDPATGSATAITGSPNTQYSAIAFTTAVRGATGTSSSSSTGPNSGSAAPSLLAPFTLVAALAALVTGIRA